MIKWFYGNEAVEDISYFPEGTHGFVYSIKHKPTGKIYVGKKVLYYNRNKKLGKKELAILKEERKGKPGRLPTKKLVTTESNWKEYWGSNKALLELSKVEPHENFERFILHICHSKKMLTYYETKELFDRDVLLKDNYFNDNILSKFYSKDFENN